MDNTNTRKIAGFLLIVFLGAALTFIHWTLLIVAGIIGGYLIEDTKKVLSAFVAGILAYLLLFLRYFFSEHFKAVTDFINSVAGLPALPAALLIGGILALLGALIGAFLHKTLKK